MVLSVADGDTGLDGVADVSIVGGDWNNSFSVRLAVTTDYWLSFTSFVFQYKAVPTSAATGNFCRFVMG